MPVNCSVVKKGWVRKRSSRRARATTLAVLGRKLLQAEHGDDVLELRVLRERAPDLLRQRVVPFADDARRGHLELDCSGSMAGKSPSLARLRESTIDAERCENVCTAAGSVKSSAGTYTAWIEVMAPVSVLAMRSSSPTARCPSWADSPARRHLAHQAGHLHAGLDEAEDVVDEQQHVAVLVVAEILGHGQRRVADAEAAARRLVHLAEDHHHVRQHAGFLHVAVELLAFAAAFADAAKMLTPS
jgi:hypothetical protein